MSAGYLRGLLREAGVPLDPLVEGVRQDSFDSLERTLAALAREYAAGDRGVKDACRAAVIEAKDHARWALKRHPEKQEMIEWMLVWLENPRIFETWVRLRRRERDY